MRDVPGFREVTSMALDHRLRFHMTCVPRLNVESAKAASFSTVLARLMDFAEGNLPATQENKHAFAAIVNSAGDDAWAVVNRIVAKNLDCGAGVTLFRKFIPEIPKHEVMLCDFASNLDSWFKRIPESRRAWSYKINGVRNWAIVHGEKGPVEHLSRSGKPYPNFSVFDRRLRILAQSLPRAFRNYPIIFDGEVISTDAHFNERISEIRTHNNADPSKFLFNMFDIVVDNEPLWLRYAALERGMENADGELKGISIVPMEPFRTREEMSAIYAQAINDGHEGLVLKDLESVYERKRSKFFVKVVPCENADVRVVKVVEGKGKLAGSVGTFVIDYKGHTCEAGPGHATHEQLKEYLRRPPKMIEVKYREITPDGALLFPVFVRVRDDK